MKLRVLDELIAPEGRGVVLLSMDEDNAPLLVAGLELTDALGKAHSLQAVSMEDGVYMLHLPQGEAAYFERLFRNIRVDATLFTFEPGKEPPCP